MHRSKYSRVVEGALHVAYLFWDILSCVRKGGNVAGLFFTFGKAAGHLYKSSKQGRPGVLSLVIKLSRMVK